MAVLTPQLFHDAIDDVWAKAQADFAASHYVVGHLIGFSRDVTMCNIAQAGTPDEITSMQAIGITPIPPGPWQHHLGLIDATLRTNGSVAAIWLGEAWTVSGDAALDVLTSDTSPSQHPFKDEFVYLYATWPRARIHRLRTMRIDRGKLGGTTPVLEAFPDGHPMNANTFRGSTATDDQQRDESQSVAMFGWLADLLPQPPTG